MEIRREGITEEGYPAPEGFMRGSLPPCVSVTGKDQQVKESEPLLAGRCFLLQAHSLATCSLTHLLRQGEQFDLSK